MNIIDAIKTNKPIRRDVARHKGSHGTGWLDPQYILTLMVPQLYSFGYVYEFQLLTQEDILAEDWQVKE